MSAPWWRPLPFALSCLGWLLGFLLASAQWIWMSRCCQWLCCCCRRAEGDLDLRKGKKGGGGLLEGPAGPCGEDTGQPLLLHCSPMPRLEENNGENVHQSPGSAGTGTGSGSGESETRSLDRHLFWQRASTKSSSGTGGKPPTGSRQKQQANGDFDSPGVSLLDPCSSSSTVQLASAPHRFASFLSRRLKRTKSYPKLQNGISREDLQQKGQQPRGQLLLRPSLGPNALRTDQQQQQQRSQPLSLYLPGGPLEDQLKASRSFESLVLFGQAGGGGGHPFLQKSPSESDHRLLLCPMPSQSQQFLHQQPSLQSSTICLESGGAAGRCWMDSSSSSSLRGRMQPPLNRDQLRRMENSLSVWVLEAKAVPPKRRFFCEISLDQVVRARTSAKTMAEGICFWGEQFDFQQLPPSQLLCIDLFREAEPSKKRRSGKNSHEDLQNLMGLVRIPVAELSGRQPTEKWYPISSGDGQPASGADGQPSLRLKARYQSIQVLPLRAYSHLREFLRAHSLPLCAGFEPILGVKAKEDFANSLVRILHAERRAPEALAELAMAEVLAQENDHLLFRGNSLATKAVEAYMKLVATDYLQMALGDFVRQLLCSDLSCEVDPLRMSSSGSGPSSAQLEKNRQQLMRQVEVGWRRILACQDFFPFPLRLLFSGLRQRLEQAGRAELADNLLSSSIFLRFLCPAILSPSLFGLVSEFPTGQAARNLTLIAKSLQTLANFTRFGGKEAYMEFMNAFVEREWRSMHQFLSQISAPCPRHCPGGELQSKAVDANIDLGKELSLLNSYLRENWTSQMQEQQHNGNDNNAMGQLWAILVALSTWDICEPEEEAEGEAGEEEEEASLSQSCNPPSDYENNAVNVGSVGKRGGGGSLDERRSQQPLPSRRAILPPQPLTNAGIPSGNGPSSAPPLPLVPPPPFSPSAAAHLHSSDDYVLGSALAKLRTGQPRADGQQQQQQHHPCPSSIIHLYDETPPPPPLHLYDEVAAAGNGQEKALASGVVMAQRGVASHEAQRRELCTPRMVQRGKQQLGRGGTRGEDEADDESDSEEEQAGEGAEEAHGQMSPRGGSSSSSLRQSLHQRRVPRKRSGQLTAGHHQPSGDRQPTNASQAQVHFDSSSASAVSNSARRPSTAAVNGQIVPVPSSGYQSQLNSSSYSSNSSSPVDTTAESSLASALVHHSHSQPVVNGRQPAKHSHSVGSSSCSSSSAYSSLSPNQQQQLQQNGGCLPASVPPNKAPRADLQIGQQHWPSPRERAQTSNGQNGIARESAQIWPSQQTPRPRTNPSCWSIPGSSGPAQARQAFVGSSPGDPLGAFIRYPTPSAAGPLPQKFPTAAELANWPGTQQQPTIGNGNPPLYPSASVDLGIGRVESGRQQKTMAELELIETQRRQIAELSRENAALRRELDTVRAISHCSLPGERAASESI